MATFVGALILVILGCVAVYGFLTESGAAKRRSTDSGRARPAPEGPPNKPEPGSDGGS